MFQCGLLIPASETSELSVFNDIFLDIGDEQSLDNDLSTYSSHLLNMREMLVHANDRSLVLIDEFERGRSLRPEGLLPRRCWSNGRKKGALVSSRRIIPT